MINYNWESTVIEFGLGISCCSKPEEGKALSAVWNRVQPGLVGLLNSLQGNALNFCAESQFLGVLVFSFSKQI